MEQRVFKCLGLAYNSKQSNECKKSDRNRLRAIFAGKFRKGVVYGRGTRVRDSRSSLPRREKYATTWHVF